MARLKNTSWNRRKYWWSAVLVLLPAWFYYQSQNPVFPAALEKKPVGPFTVSPMPYTEDAPYQHDGLYVKDYLLMFSEGRVAEIRQAYLNIGPEALPLPMLQNHDLGILHGTRHGQHVHALAKEKITAEDKIWLTIETWTGEKFTESWEPAKG